MNYLNELLTPVSGFGVELTRLKSDIAKNIDTETRFNALVGLSIINLAIGVGVRGIKSRPLQTGLVSFFGFGFFLYPEMYFPLIRQKKVQQKIEHYFIIRD